ncbi:olfactory receptor 1-like [Spea bombifrons]|uniref:olfactory receptor 1-like n=1 Tax=Spea bombifrons TaxID=233779 RepID=UPI0023495A36|nr:olfactory receptor 1-like [Spea bombifrons]
MMENQTVLKEFFIHGFSNSAKYTIVLFVIFLLIYLLGILGNLIIIIVIFKDVHLHTPMYYFICNLSSVDIFYTTVTLPKLMDIQLTGKISMSFIQCFSQMYFFIFMGVTEVLLLSSMAYDRYIAICFPLQYQYMMSNRKCILIFVGIWMSACGNALYMTGFASTLSFCHSNKLQQFFCDIKALSELSCADMIIYVVVYVETFFFGLCPFLLILISYVKIITGILHIRSKDGRRKAFSTCTSHLTVLFLFYATILWLYTKPPIKHSEEIDQVFSVLYTAVTPMLNPLIYSLRNKEIKDALIRLLVNSIKSWQT